MKMRKPLSALLAVLCIFTAVLLLALSASAEGERSAYATTSSASVQQGSYAYLYVYVNDMTDLSALNVSVYYDASKVTVKSTSNKVAATLYDITTASESVNASYIFDGKSTATQAQLFSIYYQVNSTAEPGDTYFDVVVTEAYDAALNDITFRGSRCPLAITQKPASQQSCTITSTATHTTAVGEEFELSYRLSTYQIASGELSIQYDRELFEVVAVTPGAFLSDKIYDVNTALDGEVYLSFVGTAYKSNYDLVTLRFKTLKNVDETSQIKLKVNEFCDLALANITCSGYTSNVSVVFDESYTEDAPDMRVDATYSAAEGKLTAVIRLEQDSMLGAGDFVLRFDPNVLSFADAVAGSEMSFLPIDRQKVDEGILTFYVISTEGITAETTVITVTFDVEIACSDRTTELSLSGSNLSDSMLTPIRLNFVDGDAAIPLQHAPAASVEENYVAPQCTTSGSRDSVVYCSKCDAELSRETETLDALGHDVATTWTSENDQHFHACTADGCTYKEDVENCSGGTATCVSLAVCDVCSGTHGTYLAHDCDTTWTYDDTHHWHACSGCTLHFDEAIHGFVNDADIACDCGYIRTVVLENAIDNVYATLSGKAGVTELTSAITALEEQIRLAKAYADSQDTALLTALEQADDAIEQALTALTQRVTELEEALEGATTKVTANTTDLTKLKADVATLQAWRAEAAEAIGAIEALSNAVDSLESGLSSVNTAVGALQGAMTTAEAEIDDALLRIAALESKVAALESAKETMEAALAALQNAMNAKADAAAVDAALAELRTAISTLEDVKTDFAAADEALQEELMTQINAAKASAISAAQSLVNDAKSELQDAIDEKADAATVNDAISELRDAIGTLEAVKNAYVAADNTLKSEIEAQIDTTKSEMIAIAQELVKDATAELQAALKDTREELENADAQNKAALEKAVAEATASIGAENQSNQTLVIIGLAISVLSLVGVLAMAVYVLLLKKRSQNK